MPSNKTPTPEQIAKAKTCSHKHKEWFIDSTFTRSGMMCVDCHLVLEWDDQPKPRKEHNVLDFIKGAGRR